MCCCHNDQMKRGPACGGGGREEHHWLSRTKQAEALKAELGRLESRADDIREYLRELEG